MRFQHPLPQFGPWAGGHVQCCCCRENPIPVLLQLLNMQVGQTTSKLLTPSSINVMICVFDSWKIYVIPVKFLMLCGGKFSERGHDLHLCKGVGNLID